MGSLREGLGRLGNRSVTHPEVTRPAGRDLGGARCRSPATAPCWPHVATSIRSGSARSPRTTRSATLSPTPTCPRWSSKGIWTAGQIVRPIQACGIRRTGGRSLLCSDRLGPVAEDRPHFYGQPGDGYCRRTGQLAVLAGPGQRVPVDAVPLGKGPACAASRLPAPARRRGWALADQRRCTGAAKGSGNLRRRLPPRCSRSVLTYHRRDNLPGQIRA